MNSRSRGRHEGEMLSRDGGNAALHGALPCVALLRSKSRFPERRHDIAREPTQLVLELGRRQSFGPVDHEILEPGVLGFDRLDPLDDLGRRATEPSLLLHAVADRGDRRRRARSAPSAALLIGIAYEPERREPLVALVMCRLDTADRLLLAARVRLQKLRSVAAWNSDGRSQVPLGDRHCRDRSVRHKEHGNV